MTELSFAKSFLSTLDARPVKLQSDHVADLKTLELKGAYTLPRYHSSPTMQPPSSSTTQSPSQPSSSQPQPTPSSQTQPQKNESTINLTLKSLRSPPLTLTLPSLSPSTSIFSLKQRIAAELQRDSTEGIKILYARKPCGDGKNVGEVLGEEGLKKCGGEVEMGVMVMGVTAGEQKKAGGAEEGKGKGDVEMGGMEQGRGGEGVKLAQGKSGEEVLGSDEFWDDLRGWLMQRVRDEGVVGEVWGAFKRGWDER